MPTISEIRAQYPQYNDMSDEKLADALHAKYYSDMPKEDFYLKIGMGKGIKAVAQDIKSGISNIPDALVSALSNLPGQAYKSGKQVITHPIRAAENVGAGALEGLKGAVNIPSNIATYLGSKDIGKGSIEDFIKQLKIGDTGLQQKVLGAPQPGDELLQGIGSFAPFGVAGGAEKGIAGLAKRMAANTAYSIGQNQNPITNVGMGAAGEGITAALQKALRRSNFLPSSPLSDEELRAARDLTVGTKTDLGNVIQNPQLKRIFENVLPDIPLSGAHKAMQETAANISNKGENILNQLRGDFEGTDVGSSLQKALKKAEAEARQQKNDKFAELNKAAEEKGIATTRNNMRQVAQQSLKTIENDPDLASLTDSETKRLLDKFSSSKAAGPEKFSLKNTDILRGKLREKAQDAYENNNKDLSNIYGSLKTAAEKDINEAIDNSKDEKLHGLRDEAMKFYKENYAPFEDPDIMKYTRKGGDTDTLTSAFVKNSRISDRANLLNKLSAKLSPEERQLLSYSYFSRAIKDGQLQPQTLKTLFKSLGDRQKDALLTDEMKKSLSDYSKLVEKNTEPLNVMFNPKTGQRLGSAMSLLGPLGGAAGALATGNLPIGFLAGIAPNLLARPAVKVLTHEGLRNKIIESMIKARVAEAKPTRNISPIANALMQASNRKPLEIEINKYAGIGNPA